MRTLVDGGVEVVFTNPGTTELHLVGALDLVPQLRGVLALFEGVVTGAADGYARIAGKPAATLLHLGPGFAYGLTNLHNSRRANSPVVNIVGDHPTYHNAVDPPLASDIAALGGWLRSRAPPGEPRGRGDRRRRGPGRRGGATRTDRDRHHAGGRLVVRRRSGGRSCRRTARARGRCRRHQPGRAAHPWRRHRCPGDRRTRAAGGRSLRGEPYRRRHRRARPAGALLQPGRAWGRSTHVPRLGFYPDQALEQLAGVHHVITAGAKAPWPSSPTPTSPAASFPRTRRPMCSPRWAKTPKPRSRN
ncbi:thiamine pyrophosphate-binding protein [Micromonospora sp. BRA006-A]|nr:thiamine pyrophosphate-binding protein [Micromonospora sp. BRA006-A]